MPKKAETLVRARDVWCPTRTVICGITLTCDRRPGHDGLHRDSHMDMTWPQSDSSSEEG